MFQHYSYIMQLHKKYVIDSHKKGNYSRFINHSCEPNYHVEIWEVNGLPRMIIVASNEIYPNDELSFDYNLHCYNPLNQQLCNCGSGNSRRTLSKVIGIQKYLKKMLPILVVIKINLLLEKNPFKKSTKCQANALADLVADAGTDEKIRNLMYSYKISKIKQAIAPTANVYKVMDDARAEDDDLSKNSLTSAGAGVVIDIQVK